MRWNINTPIITWLELAVSPRWQTNGSTAVVHPVTHFRHKSCFGISLDRHWLCSNEGQMTVFDSLPAATRFLSLLKIENIAHGELRDIPEQADFQCYRLGSRGLTSCNKCSSPAHAPLPRREASWANQL